MKSTVPAGVVLLALTLTLGAADSVGTLRQRVDELERENAALKSENARLRRLMGEPPTSATKAAPAPAPEVRRLEEDNRQLRQQLARAARPVPAPALTPGKTYAVEEFINLFAGDFLGAEAALRGQKVRVRGAIDRMEKVFLSTTHKLTLRGASPVRLVQARVAFSGKYNPRLTPDGGTLLGTKPFGDDFVFARTGGEVVVEGVFAGMKENLLVIEEAQLAK